MENRFKMARTVYNQHGPQSTKEVEKETRVTKSLIEDIESTAGKPRNVGYLTIKKLAEYYGVSADYLLGLSDTPSVKEDIQAACKTTGLSDDSINHLKRLANIRWGHDDLTLSNAINSFMGSEGFVAFMMGFWCYQIEVEELAKRERYFMQKLKEYEGQLPSGMTLLEYAARLSLESESCLQSEARLTIEQADNVNYKLFKLEQALKRITDSYQKEVESNGQHHKDS